MRGGLTFAEPLWLLLLPVVLAIAVWSERRSRVRLAPGRAWATRALRALLLALLVLALAQLTAWRAEERLSVVFAVDVSKSVGSGARDAAVEVLRQVAPHLPQRDRAGVVVFGESPMVESHPSDVWEPGALLAAPGDNGTDLESTVRLARGLFAPGHEARLVLLTDGVETTGSIEDAVTDLGDSVDLVWLPLEPAGAFDVLVDQVSAPELVLEDEPHRLRIVVRASADVGATLRVYRGSALVSAAPVTLRAGRPNVFTVEQSAPPAAGALLYRAEIEAPGDLLAENNRASAFVRVEGRPRVLLVDADPRALRPLGGVLERAGMRAEVGAPGRLPVDVVGLSTYDAVALSNVPATRISEGQQQALRAWVEAAGGGLVMLGGPRSFGLGGYWDTPVETVLPVDMEVKDRTHHPSLGLVFCIDKSGSMAGIGKESKIEVAKTAAAEVARQLTPMDRVGVIAFDAAAKWVVPMTSGGDRDQVVRWLGTLRAGGGTDAYPAMELARGALGGEEVRVKHVILLTDGQLAARNHEGLARIMESEGITVSAVGVGSDADPYTLERIAQWGGGLFYGATDIDRLPRIFLREAFRVSRSWMVEERFRPVVRGDHPALAGLDLEGAPALEGYVAASEKAGAQHPLASHRGDPLLSLWRFGSGKAVAFTSDAGGRWSAAWLSWPGYATFWSRIVRWVARDRQSGGRLQAQAQVSDGRLHVSADLFAADGSFADGASLRAVVMGPDGQRSETALRQVGPGRYEADVEASQPGPYMAAVLGGEGGVAVAGSGAGAWATAVVPYSSEFRGLERAPEALERLVAAGAMRRGAADATLFEHRGTGGPIRRSLAPWLLVAASVLFVGEVGVRRLRLGREVFAFLRRARGAAAATSERLTRLRGARERVRRRYEPERSADAPADGADAPSPTAAPVAEGRAGASSEAAPSEAPDTASAPPAMPPPGEAGAATTSRLIAAKRRRRRGRS